MNKPIDSVSKNANENVNDSLLTERRKLEIVKLKAEISKLESKPKINLVPLATVGLAILGFFSGILQFNKGQKLSADKIFSAEKIAAEQIQASEEQSRKDLLASKKQEYLQKFWQERLKLYEEVTLAAGQIASSRTLDDARTPIGIFWRLYWGPLSILEDRAVLSAMVTFGKKLKEAEAGEIMLMELQTKAYDLARACRKSLKNTWNPLDLDDIDDFSLNLFRPSKN